ncbi:MAG: CPBP family intramembrane metalloprotease [Planctomycetes bacterium]|nr:CPBP family intramembrane metalloprotease [Planctomycetota bacterium]
MQWSKIKLIFLRELRDQLRDRRTLFTIAVLPLILYPLLGMSFLQVAQFTREHRSTILLQGADDLPSTPRLLDGENFAAEVCPGSEAQLLRIVPRPSPQPAPAAEELRQEAQKAIRSGQCDAVVYFPHDFGERLAAARAAMDADATSGDAETVSPPPIPEPRVFASTANDKSRIAADRVERILRRWRELMVQQNLRHRNIPLAATEPFHLVDTDVAEEVSRRAVVWSKILPFVVLIWALTGAFYPAIDLCAGEKERGTLETLLSSPALRGEIVWGKLLTVMTFSTATALLNLASIGLTGTFIISRLTSLGGAIRIGLPPLGAMLWLAVALIPISALFSALSLAIAAFARSSKEGQYYLMPLLMITLPLMMIPLLPSVELDWGSSLIPVSGMMLLLRAVIEGQFRDAITHLPSVILVTMACCWLSIRWAIDQFNNEGVIFREGERWSLGAWLRHLWRFRERTPTFGMAILCGVSLLLVRFFASFLIGTPQSWSAFAVVLLATQLALIALPPLLMTGMLTTSWRQTMLLRWPGFPSLFSAVFLALAFHPAALVLHELIQWLYPLSPDVRAAAGTINALAAEAHWLPRLLVLALTPAICEELAFRGFILSGLRHMGHKWGAIVVSSLFFGAVHGMLQQSLSACAVGIVIGYIAVQTGSLLPCILFHVTHNSLVLTVGVHGPRLVDQFPQLRWIYQVQQDQFRYQPYVTIAGLVLAAGFLAWYRLLPFRATEEERLRSLLEHQALRPAAK